MGGLHGIKEKHREAGHRFAQRNRNWRQSLGPFPKHIMRDATYFNLKVGYAVLIASDLKPLKLL